MKIAINKEIGGFYISRKTLEILCLRGVSEAIEYRDLVENWDHRDRFLDHAHPRMERNDPRLIEVLEELSLENPHLKIIEVPDGIEWDIGEADDGREWVYEKHRTWS